MIAPIESSLPTPMEGMKRLCSDPKLVFFSSTYVMEYAEQNKEIDCRVMSLPQSSFADTLCLIVRKESPYRDILNYKLVCYFLNTLNYIPVCATSIKTRKYYCCVTTKSEFGSIVDPRKSKCGTTYYHQYCCSYL